MALRTVPYPPEFPSDMPRLENADANGSVLLAPGCPSTPSAPTGPTAPWLPHGTGASVEGVEVAGRRASLVVASVVRRGLRHSPLSAVVPGEELAPVLLAVFAVLVATAVPFRALA